MPIYSNLYANLARQGITKTFTQGYAQSVVAVTHPQVYASNNRPGFSLQRRPSKLTPFNGYHFQNAFHSSAAASSHVVAAQNDRADGGLEAYFDAWKKAHAPGEPEEDWVQFQFTKLIEWKPESSQLDLATLGNVQPPPLERAHSTSAIDDRKERNVQGQLNVHEVAALAHVDAALEKEIQARVEQEIFDAELSVVAARAPSPARAQSTSLPADDEAPTSPISVVSEQSRSYAEHLGNLARDQRYAEIPAVFEAMLVANIKPTAAAYNALLDAAIHLPTERIQVVPKALDVYSDMLKRKVLPDTLTYDKLIGVLASRALEVSTSKAALEMKRTRFGGMDEPGKFMLASHELEYEILQEDDRLDLALRMFDAATAYRKNRSFSPQTYHLLISACCQAKRIDDVLRLHQNMTENHVVPLASTFASMITGHAASGDLVGAINRYTDYKKLAMAADNGAVTMENRDDMMVYTSVLHAYVTLNKVDGAIRFYDKLRETVVQDANSSAHQLALTGLIKSMLAEHMFSDARHWADQLVGHAKMEALASIARAAADVGNRSVADDAFHSISPQSLDVETLVAMLSMSIRSGDIAAAQQHWSTLVRSGLPMGEAVIEPTAMFTVAMIKSGHVAEGLNHGDAMFAQIRSLDPHHALQDQLDEATQFVADYMHRSGLDDPRDASPLMEPALLVAAYEDAFDPYAYNTDFKGSAWISEELERGSSSRRGSRLNEALNRLRNIRRAGRHPRYITYAKLISAAAREERINVVHEVLNMARTDVPLLLHSAVVRYGWVSILDAMVAGCLTVGDRALAAQFHRELNEMGASPSANTFGLYITTRKESTKSFDEASEALQIFHRAKAEGVELSSFLYNALIGKLGKARRIDDCLLYFSEMRNGGIRPTSVTYGTIVNALCRVSDERFAEELFEEMESMPNYKARPAPYNSLMQFFLTTKRDKSKVLAYYQRMKSNGIEPTNHTYKLLIDTHATLEPIDLPAAEDILEEMRRTGQKPDAVHYASLIHAKGCVLHDLPGARAVFDSVLAKGSIRPQACLFQALLEAMVANHRVADAEPVLKQMSSVGVAMTPYIANTLIHGWTSERNIEQCQRTFTSVRREHREPSTYEAMTRAYLAVQDRVSARRIVDEMLQRGYPVAVSSKIADLLGPE